MLFPAYLIFLLLRVTFCQDSDCDENVCDSPECSQMSSNIFDSMNVSVSSCDDFYERACGRWIHNTTRPESVNIWGHTEILEKKILEDLRSILEEPIDSTDSFPEKKVKMLYKSCMDTDAMDEAGITILESIINGSDIWPMIETENGCSNEKTSWENIHSRYARLTGIGGLLNVHVVSNDATNNVPTISLNQPATLYGKYYTVHVRNNLELYTQFISTMASTFINSTMSNISMQSVENDINDIIQFRRRLRRILDEPRGKTAEDDINTIQDLQNFTDNANGEETTVNWLSLIRNCFPDEVMNTINSTEKIVINEIRYVKRLIPLLKETPCRTLKNHISLYFVERYVMYTISSMRTLTQELDVSILQLPNAQERWKNCVNSNQMKHVLSSMYVKKHFPRTSKDDITAMTEKLRDVLKDRINETQWLSTDSKSEALLKVERMQIQVGYPDWYENETCLQTYYNGQIVTTNYLRNVLNYMGNEYKLELLTLRNTGIRQTTDIYPIDVNAYFVHHKNLILANAAYLQWPYYTKGGPDSVNYATAGTTIAHEMGHAFSVAGLQYNSLGEVASWLSNSSSAMYDTKLNCLNDMYDNYTAPETDPPLRMNNGFITANENIADVIGLKVAYDAFQRKVSENPTVSPKTIQGFDSSTVNQLFFYSYATTFCEVLNADEINTMRYTNDHNFGRFRVNVPATLMPEFAETFSCSPGSPMRPEETCKFLGHQSIT